MFVKILTADGKYSLLNRDNLRQPIQMKEFQKKKSFSEFFFYIFEMQTKLRTFSKRDDPHS